MPKMSIKYGLSQRYTNHCLRVTSTQVLDDAIFEGRHIIRVTGHKSESSVKSYGRTLSFSRKKGISHTLSKALENNTDKENAASSKRRLTGQASQPQDESLCESPSKRSTVPEYPASTFASHNSILDNFGVNQQQLQHPLSPQFPWQRYPLIDHFLPNYNLNLDLGLLSDQVSTMPDPFQSFQTTGARNLPTQTSFQPVFNNCQVNINLNNGQYQRNFQEQLN